MPLPHPPRIRRSPALLALLGALPGCGRGDGGAPDLGPYVEQRQACSAHDPRRSLFFGDLHVHTTNSFDAHAFDVRTTPDDAYRFARGEALALPPLDASGQGTRTVRLSRPLDFAAVTDHSEFLGEVEACTTPGSTTYDSRSCSDYRQGGRAATAGIAIVLAVGDPQRDAQICGGDGSVCQRAAATVWQRIQEAAEAAYDRSADCRFTSFVAYEYSSGFAVSTLHRNVIFKNERVPAPTTYFEQPTPAGLWQELRSTCLDGVPGCDVLAIPHNPNESNGRMFFIEQTGDQAADRAAAATRAALEPVMEIYQHKGDSECMNGLLGILGAPDEACGFEKSPRDPFIDCGDGVGSGGSNRSGCYSVRDFARGALLEGLKAEERLSVNPLRLGFIASTDSHNGDPGNVDEHHFLGHRGSDDDTTALLLGYGNLTPGGVWFSPGGLAAVWAEDNSRAAIFEALRRREVYGTSGPRIAVRLFAGWALDAGLCQDPGMVATADSTGVPMGAVLPDRPAGSTTGPAILVSALREPDGAERPGAALAQIQIVKGWIDGGNAYQKVFDVAGDGSAGQGLDTTTCQPGPGGSDSLCTVWRDPEFTPAQSAFYYARVLEIPTCRWSTIACNGLPPDGRPPGCSDPAVPRSQQERAWTSPVWYRKTP